MNPTKPIYKSCLDSSQTRYLSSRISFFTIILNHYRCNIRCNLRCNNLRLPRGNQLLKRLKSIGQSRDINKRPKITNKHFKTSLVQDPLKAHHYSQFFSQNQDSSKLNKLSHNQSLITKVSMWRSKIN